MERILNNRDSSGFTSTVLERVNNYFSSNNIPTTATLGVKLKAAFFLSSFFLGILVIFMGILSHSVALVVYGFLGLLMAGIGMNVMHDANHDAFSSKPWVNKLLGSSIYILAGDVKNWKVQHNDLHHLHTNILGYDEDLNAGRILRFSDKTQWKWYHSLQRIWIFPLLLYSLLTLNWAIRTDFIQTYRYLKNEKLRMKYPSRFTTWSGLILRKIIYFSFWIFLPIFIFEIHWQTIVYGFLIMHMTAGIILSNVFQLAHVNDESKTYDDSSFNEKKKLENNFHKHQLWTTTNFAVDNWFVNFYTGGLNRQVEHHIFFHICHAHYKRLSKIVKKTAREFKQPYPFNPKGLWRSLTDHYSHLKELGKKPKLLTIN